MKLSEQMTNLKAHAYDELLIRLYGSNNLEAQTARYCDVLQKAKMLYGDRDGCILSAPGRCEIGGNHTDHQLGRVLCASIDLDMIAVVIPTDENIIRYHSEGFEVKPVDISDLSIRQEEKNTTESLIRGLCAGFVKNGHRIGGFSAYGQSTVLPGSGMSSSAAFEVLIGTILNSLFNEDKVPYDEIAKLGQYAENVYFMKPCGLLDQMACAGGGFTYIDFADPDNLDIRKVSIDLVKEGYTTIITNCGGSHADLSDEYGKVPAEMKSVAKALGQEVLSRCSYEELASKIAALRPELGDRAILRAIHFFNETKRAKDEFEALEKDDVQEFLRLVNASGMSSWTLLQNVAVPGSAEEQPMPLALAVSQQMLGKDEACRVHGGGFAGTILTFVKNENKESYVKGMEAILGEGACHELMIRPVGGLKVIG